MDLAKFLIELIVGTVFFLPEGDRHKRFWLRLVLSGLAAYGVCALNDWMRVSYLASMPALSVFLQYFVAFLMVVLVIVASYRIFLWQALFCTSSGYALQNASHYIFVILLNLPVRPSPAAGLFLLEYGSLLLVYLVAFFLTKPLRHREHGTMAIRSVVVMSLLTLFFTIVLSSQVPIGGTEYMLFYVYSLFSALMVLFLQYGLYEKYILIRETEIIKRMHYMENRQRKISEDSIALINIKCHDIKHQIHSICQKENVRSSVVEELNHAVNLYDAKIETGNAALDVVLTEKNFQCEQEHITFSCILAGQLFDFMDAADIYSLFGNALDNAIESVVQEPEDKRFITLRSIRQGNLVCLHLDNYCSRHLVFEDGLPQTTKKDAPGYHGYGVKSIRFLAEKYGGHARMSLEDSQFVLDVFFPSVK